MTEHAPASESREPEELRDAWLSLSDDLLAGLGHTLNNRVAALSGVLQLITGSLEPPIGPVLSRESIRMQEAVQLLRLLVRRWDTEPEPLQITEVLHDAVLLLEQHRELRDLKIDLDLPPDLAPVLSPPSSLIHAFCLLMAVVAQHGQGIEVRGSGDSREVRIEILPHGERRLAPEDSGGTPLDPLAARPLLARAGSDLQIQQEAGVFAGLRVCLPTLAEARRREQGG